MRKFSVTLGILGVLFLSLTYLSYAQIQKVKISDLKERAVDESQSAWKDVEYQPEIVTNPISTNSPGVVVGSTWYEHQHNGTMPRMIALDSLGGIHFNWTNGLESDPDTNRYVDYNYFDSAGSWLGAVHITPFGAAGGFTGIAGILPDGRELLCFHQRETKPGDAIPWNATLAVERTQTGAGDFYRYDIPDSLPGVEGRGIWPRAAIDSLNNIHVVMMEHKVNPAVVRAFGYSRCYIDDTTLVCEAPGVNTVRIMPNTLMNYPTANLVAIVDSTATNSYTIVASAVSKKVAVVYTKYANLVHPQMSGDVYYIESTNCGQDWIDAEGFESIEKHNITSYTSNDTIRAYQDVAVVYDYDDNLHILWTTHGYWEAQNWTTTDSCFLWHWSELSGITLVADGWKPSNPGGGWIFDRTIAKMSIGVNPTNNYLYATWTQFDSSDTAFNGYSNGEIYASASSDGGLTWDIPRNLTNTHTPGCQAGECECDHWSSLAEIVKDTLHIQYINDKDAGFFVFGEGLPTDNPVLYLKVPAWTPENFPLTANFSAEPESGFAPLDVDFTDLSSGNPTSWFWDFGDDSTSTDSTPTHTYNDMGYYNVKLVVSNSQDIDSLIKENYIHVLLCGDVNLDCVVDLGDVLYLISYLYKNGPAPSSFSAADVNSDQTVDLGDVLYLINYLYKNGPAPECQTVQASPGRNKPTRVQ